MEVLAKCPKCDAGLPVPAANAPAAITCGGCGRDIPLSVSDALRDDRAVDRCPVCSGGDFYIRKDFDPKIGLTVVIIGALISAGFYWFGRDLIAYSILGGGRAHRSRRLRTAEGPDRLLPLPHASSAARIRAQAVAFDLHTADVLEMEYERRIGRDDSDRSPRPVQKSVTVTDVPLPRRSDRRESRCSRRPATGW